MVRGFYKLIGLLAAVTLKQIHGIYGYCVASNVVFVHGGLLTFTTLLAGPPLYTPNDRPVITPYLVVTACCRASRAHAVITAPPDNSGMRRFWCTSHCRNRNSRYQITLSGNKLTSEHSLHTSRAPRTQRLASWAPNFQKQQTPLLPISCLRS